ncbi:hypothetical protein OROGR_023028 [Orobanche gracilis]
MTSKRFCSPVSELNSGGCYPFLSLKFYEFNSQKSPPRVRFYGAFLGFPRPSLPADLLSYNKCKATTNSDVFSFGAFLLTCAIRYSNKVKADVERLIQLELDDLEIDEEEKYSRKLDFILFRHH